MVCCRAAVGSSMLCGETCHIYHACCLQDEAAVKAKGMSAGSKGGSSSAAVRVVYRCKFKGCKMLFASPLNQLRCHMSHPPSARTALAKVRGLTNQHCCLSHGCARRALGGRPRFLHQAFRKLGVGGVALAAVLDLTSLVIGLRHMPCAWVDCFVGLCFLPHVLCYRVSGIQHVDWARAA